MGEIPSPGGESRDPFKDYIEDEVRRKAADAGVTDPRVIEDIKSAMIERELARGVASTAAENYEEQEKERIAYFQAEYKERGDVYGDKLRDNDDTDLMSQLKDTVAEQNAIAKQYDDEIKHLLGLDADSAPGNSAA